MLLFLYELFVYIKYLNHEIDNMKIKLNN